MKDQIGKHPAVALVVSGFEKFQAGRLDIVGLGSCLASARSLVENSLSKDIQNAIEWAENEVESIRFSMDTQDHAREVEKVSAKVAAALAQG